VGGTNSGGNVGIGGNTGLGGNSGGAGVPGCPAGTSPCGTQCVSVLSDPSNCGSCGLACSPGGACANGVCQCPAATPTMCGTSCTNTLSDPLNCSTGSLCGTVCGGAAPNCSNGTCSATCAVGLQDCGGGRCIDPATFTTDPTNCGGCGIACTGGRTCNAGACACPGGQELCAASNSCVPVGTCNLGTGGTGGGSAGTGGVAGTAGTGGGNPGTGGVGGGDPNNPPPGYWTSKDWHGCSWTGVGNAGTSTIMPQDFVAKAPTAAYCASGTVGAEPMYQSVALMGFNVGEPVPSTCAYRPVDVNANGPPAVTPTATGIAVDFVKRGANTGFQFRIQIQGPNGHKDGAVGEADRWCANITDVQGKVFVRYDEFTPRCWETTLPKGTPYARQPISAVVFLVPGSPTATPFDFCINGVAYGETAADAPDGPEMPGTQMGIVGGSNNDDLDFDRKKVNVGGENYIIQNNNWGNPGGSDCILSYINNSFSVTTCNGSGASAPAAFPSIYQGNNGNTANGVLSTKSSDNMPIQISNIGSLTSTFRYSGSSNQGSYNACYDIWFANSPPTGEYQDGINGFVMIWLRDPSDKQPIGGNPTTNVNIGGQQWDVYVGPRGDGPNGYNPAPVVSFVNPAANNDSRAQSFVNQNILAFLTHASVANAGIGSSMYLTDIFAGFEIWNGGVGLKVDEFTAVVTPR
jgi:hypothetical protein